MKFCMAIPSCLFLAVTCLAQPPGFRHGSYAIFGAEGHTTAAQDISDNGTIVGAAGFRGFILRQGEYTEYLASPVQGLPSAFTQIYGVNNAGHFVGEYFAQGVAATGFVDRNGVLTSIVLPFSGVQRVLPRDINNRGDIAGFYLTTQGKSVGFLFCNGNYQKIEIPGAKFVTVLGLNDSCQAVGHYTLSTSGPAGDARRGFLWSQGQFASVDYPGVDYSAGERTEPFAIGRDGTIVGNFTRIGTVASGYHHTAAFVFRHGRFQIIGIPGVESNTATGVNARGEISGYYTSRETKFVFPGFESVRDTEASWVLRY